MNHNQSQQITTHHFFQIVLIVIVIVLHFTFRAIILRSGAPITINHGLILGFASGWGIVGSIVGLALIGYIFRAQLAKSMLGGALLLGGALANMLERLLYGHIIDYLPIWPAAWASKINLGDVMIVAGVLIILINLKPKTESPKSNP